MGQSLKGYYISLTVSEKPLLLGVLIPNATIALSLLMFILTKIISPLGCYVLAYNTMHDLYNKTAKY